MEAQIGHVIRYEGNEYKIVDMLENMWLVIPYPYVYPANVLAIPR